METLKLSELIGQEISELRFHYIAENDYGMQSFHSYIKLASGTIISIPKFDDDEYLDLTNENLAYLQNRFDEGSIVNNSLKIYFVGQKITDFYFSYYNDEIDTDWPGCIQLSNGYYLTECNFGPPGLFVDLIILTEEGISDRIRDLKIEIRSFLDNQKR